MTSILIDVNGIARVPGAKYCEREFTLSSRFTFTREVAFKKLGARPELS
jgi:hypothetical protein